MSWNVNGLSSKTEHTDFIKYCEGFDIFCLTETWCKSFDHIKCKFPNFTSFFSPAFKRKTKGRRSGGIVVFIANDLIHGIKLVSNNHTDCITLLLKKDFFNMPDNLLLTFVYIHPEGSFIHDDVNDKNSYENLEDELIRLSSCFNAKIIVAGDMNGRTATVPDYLDDDSDHAHLPYLYVSDYFSLPRTSCDNVVNNFGKMLINLCKSLCIHFVNGRKPGDETGNFT